jgi:hypothetical protein
MVIVVKKKGKILKFFTMDLIFEFTGLDSITKVINYIKQLKNEIKEKNNTLINYKLINPIKPPKYPILTKHDTIDTTMAIDTLDTIDTIDTGRTIDTSNTIDTMDTTMAIDTLNTSRTIDAGRTIDTMDTSKSIDTIDTSKSIDTMDWDNLGISVKYYHELILDNMILKLK